MHLTPPLTSEPDESEADQLIDTLKQWSSICKYLLVTSPARDKVQALFSSKSGVTAKEFTLDELYRYLTNHMSIGFYGYTLNDDYHACKTTSLVISGREAVCLAPKKIMVTAIVNCYNEGDIITEVVLYLLQQNLNVIVVDNWSTDGSYEVVLALAEKQPKLKVTRFPDAPSDYFNLNEQLINTVKISQQHGYGWYIHYDADEIRESPWQNVNLQDAVSFVDSLGYNAIDFTVLNFRYLKDDSDYSDLPPTKRLRYWEFGDRPGHFKQVKAWKYYGQKVNLNKSGGHRVRFTDQKIYPFNFLTRHYPLRSSEQSNQKLYRDRLPRFDLEQKKFGWHLHYNNLSIEQLKGWHKKDLFPWHPTTFKTDYLIERISRVGIAPPKLPKSTKAFVKTICILGMHRSGTSCLAGSLQAAGVSGGAIIEYADDNLLGNRENQLVVNLNQKILTHNQGEWNCPPKNVSFTGKHQREMNRIIDLFEDKFPLWMFKDPRTVLTLSFWQENIPNLQLIGTFRHPFKVAMSLYKRSNSIPLRQGIELWIHYNSLILKELERAAFPLICFDLPQEQYLNELTKIVASLNSNIPQYCQLSISQLKEFYESNLVHQENIIISSSTPEDDELLERAEMIYRQLKVKSGLQADVEDTSPALVIPLENDRTLYLKAIELQPDRSELYFMLAKIEFDSGNIEAAIAASKQAFELNPNSINIAEQLSQLLTKTEKIGEAIALVEQILKSHPNNPRLYLILAKLQQKTDLSAAIYTYQKIINLVPHHFKFQLNIAKLLLQNNQTEAAIEHYQQALKLRPKNHQIYFDLGKAYAKQKQWQQAINFYQKAIEIKDTSAMVYIHLAKAFKRQGNKRQALKTYQRAIASHPNSIDGYIGLGNFYRQQKKWSEAIDNYQQAISLNCQDAGVYYALGESWRAKRNWNKAISNYQEAAKLDFHKSFELYKAIGDTLSELNEINSAISAYEKAMEINPDCPEVEHILQQALSKK